MRWGVTTLCLLPLAKPIARMNLDSSPTRFVIEWQSDWILGKGNWPKVRGGPIWMINLSRVYATHIVISPGIVCINIILTTLQNTMNYNLRNMYTFILVVGLITQGKLNIMKYGFVQYIGINYVQLLILICCFYKHVYDMTSRNDLWNF